MPPDRLTNGQLYQIAANDHLHQKFREVARQELERRGSPGAEAFEQQAAAKRRRQAEPLGVGYKVLALLVPFAFLIHVIVSSRWPAAQQDRKWRQYWRYLCLGLLLWMAVLLAVSRYVL